jgi:hypothetical protein
VTSPTSTSTTLPCLTAACILDRSPACADEQIPTKITRPLDRGFTLLAQVRGFLVRPTRLRYHRIGHILMQTAKRADRYATLKKPRLTMECAAELRSGIEAVAADAAADCVGLGLCRGG